MPFEPMGRVIHSLQQKQTWHEYHQFQTLLQVWESVVGKAVAAQTQPIWLTQQRVLKVATSSAVWAQNLSFERQRILAKLNTALQPSPPLTDLHFSTRQWQPPNRRGSQLSLPPEVSPFGIARGGQSLSSGQQQPPPPVEPVDPEVAFQNWSKTLQQRDRHLPLCRQCQCPTPTPELERWSMCALCAARQ
jgi:predicted nucleic acid-binding Zn ribbon protein